MSYITDRTFRVKQEEAYTELENIRAGIPQGNALGPILYSLYTSNIAMQEDAIEATFAENTAVLAAGEIIKEATKKLQKIKENINEWTTKWRIILTKMDYFTLTLLKK